MTQKGNVVLYLDKDLVEKSKELGFNLSKTFENHLKHLMTQFSTGNSVNNFDSSQNKLKRWAEPYLNRNGFKPHYLTTLSPETISLFSLLRFLIMNAAATAMITTADNARPLVM